MEWGAGPTVNTQNLNNIGKLAASYFAEGYYCSEAVLRAFEDVTGLNFSDDFKRSMTILGEGIGDSGCLCGAVASAVLIAGYFSGRLTSSEDRKYSQSVGKDIINRFKSKYQTTCCKALKKKSEIAFGIGQYRHCPEMTGFCAELILKLALDEGWVKGVENVQSE